MLKNVGFVLRILSEYRVLQHARAIAPDLALREEEKPTFPLLCLLSPLFSENSFYFEVCRVDTSI